MGRFKFWVLLTIAVGLGLVIAWIDSRPTWDDSSLTAGAILILTCWLGMSMPQRPWLWALAVGVWIPLQAILQYNNFEPLPVLIVAFIGAYTGALIRKASIALR